uniref:CxC2-like cysteine cluster KDZ transposase-associated domain-containing protein n=1 Tax=Mycena chlorophos TaxID=658473 RepID=A0ABQ0L205_MYCCL|nr:predicted protein [Mycena chlorophos]
MAKRRRLDYDTPAGTHRQVLSFESMISPTEDAPMNSFVDLVSSDGRRVHRTEVPIGAPASPVKQARREQFNKTTNHPNNVSTFAQPLVVVEQEAYQMALWVDGAAPAISSAAEPDPFESGNVKVDPADPALTAWRENDRDTFLDLLLWNDGRRGRGLSSRCRFGHPPGESCLAPHPAHSDFTVIHTTGIHSVAVDFCACNRCKDAHHVQLLRRRWYPATSDQPRTCATFVVLDAAHAMSLTSKATLFAWYEHLEWLTDGSGLKPPDRYKAVLRILREYRYLLSLKRAGRGHAPEGVKGTGSGELAVRCAACPRPGVNLPENWQSAPPRDHCLYTQFIAVDACFRLKRGMVSSNAKDPPLGDGWAYMVEGGPYREYLLTIKDQKEISSCTQLAALDHANTKFAKGYTTSGIGMAVYGNMDYILASALRHISRLLRLVVSYDIACQWWKGLRSRLAQLPPLVRLTIVLAMVRFVVPKMHIKGHTIACQLLFSLLLTLGCGQTDGEGIERMWAAINALAGSTKLNGPGARADQLDDHWGYSNWAKLVRLPALLRRRLDTARKESAKQKEAFEALNEEQAEHAPAWLRMVNAFKAPRAEDTPEPPNPYEATVVGKSEQQVRAEFEAEDTQDVTASVPQIHETSPRSFMMFGLEIEELHRIRVQAALKKAKSTASRINLGNMRRKAEGMMRQWRSLQATYMPAALVQLKSLDLDSEILIENVPLLPPSALTKSERNTGCQNGLERFEVALRQAQCRVALVALRNQLHIKSRLLKYKKFSSRHQKTNTRTRTLVNRNESKIKLHAEKYQQAWTALSMLLGTVNCGFKALKAADIRCMEDADTLSANVLKEVRRMKRRANLIAQGDLPLIDTNDEQIRDGDKEEGEDVFLEGESAGTQSGEGRRTMSWIWNETGTTGSEEELLDALRIEWCKAFSRTRRWNEELQMLCEEQRRVPVSHQRESDKWVARSKWVWDSNPGPLLPAEAELVDGKLAYDAKQRELYLTLMRRAEEVRTAPEGRRRRRKPANAAEAAEFDQHPDLPDPVSDSSDDDDDAHGDGEEPLEEGDAEDV